MGKIYNDIIYGHIELTDTMLKIIDTSEFQRLRKLKQLGLTFLVYSAAEHTRFQHCIGTSHLAREMMNQIKFKQPELGITDREVELVAIGGLCHDLGHGPYSHAFELWLKSINKQEYTHEEMSIRILERINEKGFKGTKIFTDDELNFIKATILPEKYADKYKTNKFMFTIVSNKYNGIDVDKMDYLRRDNYFTINSMSFNVDRLIMGARVIKDKICYLEKDVFNVYQLFSTRYNMHKQVYSHKTTKAAEFIMMDILSMADKEKGCEYNLSNSNVTPYVHLNDTIIDKIGYTTKNYKLLDLICRYEERDLYKCLISVSFSLEKWINWLLENDEKNKDSKLTLENLKKESIDLIKSVCDKEEIRISISKLNYGAGRSNPVNNVYFYNNKNLNNCNKISKKKVSQLLPSRFVEYNINVYTTKSQEDIDLEEKYKVHPTEELKQKCKDLFKNYI